MQATEADKVMFGRKDTDLKRVVVMELEARSETIIHRLLQANGGSIPDTLPALDGSVLVTCSLGASGDHSFLEAGILPLLGQLGMLCTHLCISGCLGTNRPVAVCAILTESFILMPCAGVPLSSLGGHLGAIQRYIGDSAKARPEGGCSSPLSRFDWCYDRRIGVAAVELLRLQDDVLKRRLQTARNALEAAHTAVKRRGLTAVAAATATPGGVSVAKATADVDALR